MRDIINRIYGRQDLGPTLKEKIDYTQYGGIKKFTTSIGATMEIKKVIFNKPATIVYWEDGTRTVVKCHNETFDPEKGLAMAICKRVYGNKNESRYHKIFKKWVPEDSYIKFTFNRSFSGTIDLGPKPLY